MAISLRNRKQTLSYKRRLMNFMEELEKETQAMLKQINIRKIEKTKKAKERISELKTLIKFWEKDT